MLNGLDLFSGIGGLTLALKPWVKPIAYCEQDRFCQALLLSRFAKGELPAAPIWDDVRTLDRRKLGELSRCIDIIYGGFPCQDISVAGSGAGLAGSRSGLFYEIMRLSEEVEPVFIFLENVPAIRKRGLDEIGRRLAACGYDCRWGIVSAFSVGAPHLRERWFLLAHANGRRSRWLQDLRFTATAELADSAASSQGDEVAKAANPEHRSSPLAYAASERREQGQPESEVRRREPKPSFGGSTATDLDRALFRASSWAVEPDVGRVAHGIPARVDRIRGLGNAVVPLQARAAFQILCGLEIPKAA